MLGLPTTENPQNLALDRTLTPNPTLDKALVQPKPGQSKPRLGIETSRVSGRKQTSVHPIGKEHFTWMAEENE